MKLIKSVFALFILLISGFLAEAQHQYEFQLRNDIPVKINNETLKNAWGGGFNSPVFSKIELNQDGTEDLFVFDRTQQKIFTYLAVQNSESQWYWKHAPQYEILFPAGLKDWVLLRDFNNDEKKDIFTKTSSGIQVFRNTTAADGIPAFDLATDYIRFNGNINLQVNPDNLPSITDVDNDGDLDILTFDFSGSTTIEYYKNMRVEQNLPMDNLTFTQVTSYWGQLKRCQHLCNTFAFNADCRTAGTNHNDGSGLLALDLDGDLDKDILVGSDVCTDLTMFTNSGTVADATFTSSGLQTNFPENTTRASFSYFPIAYYEDVTFDNKKDLLVAPFVRSNTSYDVNFAQSAWLYKNTSTTAIPAFSYERNNFLQHDMVDAGEQSAPALADVDADGDQDLLLGNRAGTVWFFRNTGTALLPDYTRENIDYLNIATLNLRDIKPQFSDINSDGRQDLILVGTTATATATIKYILNTATTGQAFNFPLASTKTLTIGQTVGDVPAFYDVDADGDKDVILATNQISAASNGPLRFYRNTGNNANPVFALENEAWGNIPNEFLRKNIYPLIIDLNKDNNPELLLTDDTGSLRIYANFLQNQSGTFTAQTEIIKNIKSSSFTGSRLGSYLTVAAADLDGDGLPELLLGNRGGGLYYFKQQVRGVLSTKDPLPEIIKPTIYPNPATQQVTISGPEKVYVAIFDVMGRTIIPESKVASKTHILNTDALKPGMYMVQVQTTDARKGSYKLLIQN